MDNPTENPIQEAHVEATVEVIAAQAQAEVAKLGAETAIAEATTAKAEEIVQAEIPKGEDIARCLGELENQKQTLEATVSTLASLESRVVEVSLRLESLVTLEKLQETLQSLQPQNPVPVIPVIPAVTEVTPEVKPVEANPVASEVTPKPLEKDKSEKKKVRRI